MPTYSQKRISLCIHADGEGAAPRWRWQQHDSIENANVCAVSEEQIALRSEVLRRCRQDGCEVHSVLFDVCSVDALWSDVVHDRRRRIADAIAPWSGYLAISFERRGADVVIKAQSDLSRTYIRQRSHE